jgi:hypothetical protein
MIISNIRQKKEEHMTVLSAEITFEEKSADNFFSLWFRFPVEYEMVLTKSADPFLAAMVIPAMVMGENITIDIPVSRVLVKNMVRIQDVFSQWIPHSRRIEIFASKQVIHDYKGDYVGQFFTCGVDSFYTLLKNQLQKLDSAESITHLLFVKGYERIHSKADEYAKVIENVRDVAGRCDKQLIEIETNLRQFSDRYALWGQEYLGSALGSVALCLSPLFKKVVIPASDTYLSQICPWGSHPIVDPLWSNDSTQIDHDGCEMPRSGKIIKYIANSDIALEKLRVCFNGYNCGKCEKCIRTMIPLKAANVLERCKTFPNTLTPGLIRKMRLREDTIGFARENLEIITQSNLDIRFKRALKRAIYKGKMRIIFHRIKKMIRPKTQKQF